MTDVEPTKEGVLSSSVIQMMMNSPNRIIVTRDDELRVETESSETLFGQSNINNLVQQPRFKFAHPVKEVFVFADCYNATIATIARNESDISGYVGYVLLGLETFDSTQAMNEFTKKHLEAVRSLSMFENARIVFSVGAGTGLGAYDLQQFVKKHFNNGVEMVLDKIEQRTGEMVGCFRDALKQGMLGIAEDFVTVHRPADTMLNIWRQQANRFTKVTYTTKKSGTTTKFTGKGANGTMSDALFRATLCCLFNAMRLPF